MWHKTHPHFKIPGLRSDRLLIAAILLLLAGCRGLSRPAESSEPTPVTGGLGGTLAPLVTRTVPPS
ncbi:MAG TPA: hypothetical protein VMT34_18555, partial [Aggregatilineales bacterium]|nr:hypothetical protein [Aggregatilineales bacterium]